MSTTAMEELRLEEPDEEPEENVRSSGLPPTDHGTEAYLVLLGCCILQLPIWGLTMSYGLFLESYGNASSLSGSRSSTGVIGTTSNAVIYLSMPILFGLFTRRLAAYRRASTLMGLLLISGGLLASSFSTSVWHLVVTQGILCAFGSSLMYSPTTLYVDEWFTQRKGFALGATLSSKNIVGSGPPFLISFLLSTLDFRSTLRIWAGVTLAVGIPAIYLLRPHRNPSSSGSTTPSARHLRRLSWKFLHHPTFYVFVVSTIVFSSGYGLPQTYLPTYALTILGRTSTTTGPLLLALFNAPGIISGVSFGILCDGFRFPGGHTMSVFGVTCMSALGSALPALLLWGLTARSADGFAMLSLFSVFYGFFAGGYSSTWGGVLREMEKEARENDEPIDTGLVYGLINGGRGLGFLAGGFVGVELLKVGAVGHGWSYGSQYGAMILFVGLSAAIGGWSTVWKVGRVLLK